MVRDDQTTIPAAYVRGGSSKAVFFHEKDLPPAGPLRDMVLKRIMGTPDPIQIDGMGGTKAVTSKIAIIRLSEREDADVDYTFAQVGVRDDVIGYDANCGNISAGVGPFAIDEGLLKTFRKGRSIESTVKSREVRIHNTGTRKTLISHVPVNDSGYSIAVGNASIAAVPGSGAPILMDYRETKGASQGKGLLPSGNAIDNIEVAGKIVKITICDAANICVFVSAADLGVSGHETAACLTEDRGLIARTNELRGKAACLVGMCEDWRKVDEQSPFMPMPILIAPPPSLDTNQSHVSGRLFLDNMCHESMAGTGAVCFAACSRIKGSVVYEQIGGEARKEPVLRIAHPLGMMPAAVEVKQSTQDTETPTFETLSFVRTARRLMDGKVYVPKEVFDPSNVQTDVLSEDLKNGSTIANGTMTTNGVHVNGSITPNGPATNGAATNGSSSHDQINTSKLEDSQPEVIPVTKILAHFAASARPEMLSEVLRGKLKEVVIDFIGVTAAASTSSESTPSILAAVRALGGENGTSTVLVQGKKFIPQYAAFLNAAFGHSMDFDDTYAEGTLHAGVTAISAGLAEAELLASAADPEEFLIAVATGYEVTCRLGKELGFEAYSQGMHNTSTAGIFGAIATISVLRKLPAHTIEMAFGFAGSKAAGSMQYLDNGSWNKRLHPGFAVHDAFVCIVLAEAGALGATKALEGKFGFLQAYSPSKNKNLKRLTRDLGKEWTFLRSALKPFPACRMTHGLIELAGKMHNTSNPEQVQQITLKLTPANYSIVGVPDPNKIRPQNVVDAQFSAYFQTANALLYGSNTGVETYTRLQDPRILELCSKTVCLQESSFESMESSLKVEYTDGRVAEGTMPAPLGEASHPFTRDLVELKFFGLVTSIYGEKKAKRILQVVDSIEKYSVVKLLELLADCE
jgi:2-methylaconitate cis-trans-isomerase PrpF/2-methylcitrate dehydratase PrpD